MKPKKNKSKKNDTRISHKELLTKIGEIDGIRLVSLDNVGTVAVYLEIDGKEIEIIRDCGVNRDHHITRTGIAEALCGRW